MIKYMKEKLLKFQGFLQLQADIKTKELIPNLVPGFKIKAVLQLKADEKNIIIPKIALQSENGKYFVNSFYRYFVRDFTKTNNKV